MRKAAIALLFASAVSAWALPPIPRKAPELTIVEPSGKQTLLSSYKGKVVVIEFLYTTCPHCQAASQVITKLQRELGPRGFQAVGVAFNDNAQMLVPQFVQQFNVGYPVGFANSDTVMGYLGLSIMDRYSVPQEVVIDRKGMIRAQSGIDGDPKLQEENSLRALIDGLLKEGVTPTSTTTKKTAVTPKKTS
jgi:peroxiredoxin